MLIKTQSGLYVKAEEAAREYLDKLMEGFTIFEIDVTGKLTNYGEG